MFLNKPLQQDIFTDEGCRFPPPSPRRPAAPIPRKITKGGSRLAGSDAARNVRAEIGDSFSDSLPANPCWTREFDAPPF